MQFEKAVESIQAESEPNQAGSTWRAGVKPRQ